MSGHPELAGLEPDEAVAKLKEARDAANPVKPVGPQFEDWTLVRAKDKRAGWVLTRMLFMAIPDEVAQYAERARIAAYFPLGTVTARDGKKYPEWFWAVLARPGQGVHFDGIRVFTYNTRRNRYETAFIDRKAEGWAPVTLERGASNQVTGLSFVARESDGASMLVIRLVRGGRLRLASRRPAERPQDWYIVSDKGGRGKQNLPPSSEPSLTDRATQLLDKLRRTVTPR